MNDKTKWENAHFEHDANPVDGSMSKPAAAQEAVAPERVAWASTGATGHKVVAMPGLHKLPYGDYDLFASPVAAAPEVPAARVTEPLRADESRQEQADSAIYNRGWNDCRAAMLAARRPAGQQPVAYQSRHALGPLGGDGWGLWTDTGRAEFERLSSLIEGNPDHFSQLVEVRALAVAL